MNKPSEQDIKRFLSNECDQEESIQIRAYFQLNPDELSQRVNVNDWEICTPQPVLPASVSDRMFQKIRKGIFRKEIHNKPVLQWSAIAASIVIVASLYWLYNISYKKNMVSYKAPVKETKQILSNTGISPKEAHLKDGSRVVLYPKTTLAITEHFNELKRELVLIGEADFFVAQNSRKPFIVFADHYATTAIGTSFKVIYRKEVRIFRVKLMSGKVKVEEMNDVSKKEVYFLTPGQQISMDATMGKMIVVKDEKKRSVSQSLLIDKATLPDLLQRLEKQYDTTIVFNRDELKTTTITAVFENGESLEAILEQITRLNNLFFIRNGGTYIIKKK